LQLEDAVRIQAGKGERMITVDQPSAEPSKAAIAQARLLIVDDHAAVRAGLRQLLSDEDGFTVVAAVADAEQAIAIAETEPVDVAVVDYQLEGRNGLWLSRKLKRLERPPAVLIYSAYTDSVLAAAAVVAEADAIVSKGGLGSELATAIRHVLGGSRSLPPLPAWLGDALRARLDHEQQAIFGLLLAGIGSDETARTLELSDAELEGQLWAMLHALEAPHRPPQSESAFRP
jgi:DNA-binding NarL/FixJ family response regulator